MHNADAVIHPAFHRYEPGAYPGKIVLIQSSDWPKGDYFDFALGWRDLVQGIEFHRVEGDHPSMFTEPNVNSVAVVLDKYLRDMDRRMFGPAEEVSQSKQ
jgi:thioesterase domain-containing protein